MGDPVAKWADDIAKAAVKTQMRLAQDREEGIMGKSLLPSGWRKADDDDIKLINFKGKKVNR